MCLCLNVLATVLMHGVEVQGELQTSVTGLCPVASYSDTLSGHAIEALYSCGVFCVILSMFLKQQERKCFMQKLTHLKKHKCS